MVLKRKKSLKNICKSLVRPGLVISAASKAENGADDLVTISTPMSVSSLTVSDVRPSAVTDDEKTAEEHEISTPHSKKKAKKKKSSRFKNHAKATLNSLKIKEAVASLGGDCDRAGSPTLSYDSGSGDEEGPQLGIGVKTTTQKVSEEVSVNFPIQCQVISNRAEHIYGLPKHVEMFFNPTGREQDIQPMGKEFGSTVYNYESKSEFTFYNKKDKTVEEAPNASSVQYSHKDPIPRDIAPDSLLFESRFESGNLMRAVRITDTYYELHIRPDLYTDRHCQWFYFRVQNMRPGVEYRFSLVNFGKPDSQYGSGMKPVMYSEKEASLNGVGWQRVGHGMRYYKREQDRDESPREKLDKKGDDEEGGKYVMSFLMSFPHGDDTAYLAHCYPYRYSDMMLDLEKIMADPERAKFIKKEVLCQTLAGNDVPILTITSSDPVYDIRNKKFVIVTSRVHPGETPSSFIMKGILHYITGNTDIAVALRKHYIFKIVPMINPDGVIVGNTRCNLAGADLNRQYKYTIKEAFPTVYHIKMLITKLLEDDYSISIYCDLHAHSRKYNVFMYGCENRKRSQKYLMEQLFPLMLHKNAKDRFNFEDCRFTMTRAKESTGRIVFWNMGITNSFTLEASYGGSNKGHKAYTHFNIRDYEQLGRYWCETLVDVCDPSPPLQHLRYKMVVKLMAEESSATDPTTINMSDYSSISSSEGDYTDIDIEDDYFLFQNVRKLARRKRRKMPPEEYKKNKEKKKLIEYISESDSSSDDDLVYYPQSHPSSAFAEGFQNANYLSDISDDEDAIHINVMRDFTRLENSKMNLKDDDEFSASACQKIHSELMASVNEIYKNLKTKPLLIRNAVSTSSLSNNSTQNFRKLSKSKSIDYKQSNTIVSLLRNKPRAESLIPITGQPLTNPQGSSTRHSTKLPKHLRRRLEKNMEENDSLENMQNNNNNMTEQMALLKLMKPKRNKSAKKPAEIAS